MGENLCKWYSELIVWTVEKTKSAVKLSSAPAEYNPYDFVFPNTFLNSDIAFLAMFKRCTTNKRRLAPLCFTSRADRTVLPVPVADITNDLSSFCFRILSKFTNASFCIAFGNITCLIWSKSDPFFLIS